MQKIVELSLNFKEKNFQEMGRIFIILKKKISKGVHLPLYMYVTIIVN